MENKTITVAVVDDHTLFRDGLINLLSEYKHLEILFGAKNGLDLRDKMVLRGVPDIILLDINMPVIDGPESLEWLKQNYPTVRALALSMYEDDVNIIRMLRKGAGGYILKESTAQELVRAIEAVYENDFFVNELVSGKLLKLSQLKEDGNALLNREIEFLKLCCSEMTYKEIAEQMKVSPRTVDGYRDQLFEKLHIKSRTGLVLYAIKNKYLPDF